MVLAPVRWLKMSQNSICIFQSQSVRQYFCINEVKGEMKDEGHDHNRKDFDSMQQGQDWQIQMATLKMISHLRNKNKRKKLTLWF